MDLFGILARVSCTVSFHVQYGRTNRDRDRDRKLRVFFFPPQRYFSLANAISFPAATGFLRHSNFLAQKQEETRGKKKYTNESKSEKRSFYAISRFRFLSCTLDANLAVIRSALPSDCLARLASVLYPGSRGNKVQPMGTFVILWSIVSTKGMRGVVGEPPGNPSTRCVGEKANSNLTNEKVSRRSTASKLPPVARDKERQRRQERRAVTICKKKKKKNMRCRHPSQTNDRGRRRRKASPCSKREENLDTRPVSCIRVSQVMIFQGTFRISSAVLSPPSVA